MTADKIQVDSDMTPLLCHVRVFSGKIVSGDKRGCPYGQPKCSEDSYLVVRDDFWLSWTTGQPLLRTLSIPVMVYLSGTVYPISGQSR